jgi:hypothetical protein
MGLLLSDAVLIEPLSDETLRLREGTVEWRYALDVAIDPYEDEMADSAE